MSRARVCGFWGEGMSSRESGGADVSLVFYAGHGIEMDGGNYLVPVDARLERDLDVRYETVTLEDMLASTFGRVPAAGDSGCVPEQPAGALDAANPGRPERERWQLRGSERGLAGGRDAGGVCGGGGVRRRRTVVAGTARTRRRCWRIWSSRWRSAFCSAGYARRCWRRRTGSSGPTSISRWWASTTRGSD